MQLFYSYTLPLTFGNILCRILNKLNNKKIRQPKTIKTTNEFYFYLELIFAESMSGWFGGLTILILVGLIVLSDRSLLIGRILLFCLLFTLLYLNNYFIFYWIEKNVARVAKTEVLRSKTEQYENVKMAKSKTDQ